MKCTMCGKNWSPMGGRNCDCIQLTNKKTHTVGSIRQLSNEVPKDLPKIDFGALTGSLLKDFKMLFSLRDVLALMFLLEGFSVPAMTESHIRRAYSLADSFLKIKEEENK